MCRICSLLVYCHYMSLYKYISPSLFPAKPKNSESCITSCKKCDICKNYLITDNKFKCKVTGRFYNVRGNLWCNSSNGIYLISCKNCQDQYIGSVIDFKARFRIHKSDIKTKIGMALPGFLIINALMSKIHTGFFKFN